MVLNKIETFLIPYLPIIKSISSLSLGAFTLAFLMRIILSWYPNISLNKGFWQIIAIPTEPFLKLFRKFINPIGGVDITPVICLGLTSLLRELIVGQQGILTLIISKLTH